jgi:hypothetical protein
LFNFYEKVPMQNRYIFSVLSLLFLVAMQCGVAQAAAASSVSSERASLDERMKILKERLDAVKEEMKKQVLRPEEEAVRQVVAGEGNLSVEDLRGIKLWGQEALVALKIREKRIKNEMALIAGQIKSLKDASAVAPTAAVVPYVALSPAPNSSPVAKRKSPDRPAACAVVAMERGLQPCVDKDESDEGSPSKRTRSKDKHVTFGSNFVTAILPNNAGENAQDPDLAAARRVVKAQVEGVAVVGGRRNAALPDALPTIKGTIMSLSLAEGLVVVQSGLDTPSSPTAPLVRARRGTGFFPKK